MTTNTEIMRNPEAVPDINNSATNEISDSAKKSVPRKKLLITSLLLSRMISSSVFPLLEISYPNEAKRREMSSTLISLVFGVYPFVNLLAPQTVKKALYRFKLRHILYVAITSSAMNTVLFGLLKYIPNQGSYNVVFIVLSFIVRAFESMGCGIINNIVMTFFATEFPNDISSLFGFLQCATGFGYASGPLFGGMLFDLGGFDLPYLVYGTLLAICLPCDMYLLRTSSNSKSEEMSSESKFTYSWEIFYTVFLIVVLRIPYSFLEAFLGFHFKGFSQTEIGLMYFLLSISFSLASILNVRIIDKISDTKMLFIVSNILTACALLLCGPSPLLGIEHKYIWLDVVSLILFGYFYNMSSMIPYRLFREFVSGDKTEQTLHEVSTINSIYYTSVFLGHLSGFVVAGPMFDICGYRWSLTLTAFLILLATLILIYQALSKYLPKIEAFRKLWSNKEERNHLLNSNTH